MQEYPKLVRDWIPQKLDKLGKTSKTRVAKDDEEYLQYLLKKIIEEATELEHSLVEGNTEEELADIFEIIYAILKLKGWTIEQIINIQKEKREKNGGFDKRLILISKP